MWGTRVLECGLVRVQGGTAWTPFLMVCKTGSWAIAPSSADTRYCCLLAAQSHLTLQSMDCSPSGSSVHGILQANTAVGSLSLLQGIFQNQGLNPGLLHCRRILHSLSYQGSPTHIYMYPYIYSVHCPLYHISVLPSEILFCLKNFLLVKWVLVY